MSTNCHQQEQQLARLMANPVFASTRLGCFVHALCVSNPNKPVDSVFRCIDHAPITLHEYSVRLGTYLKCSSSSFVLAAILVHRLWERCPGYFCDLAALKILATASVISAKFLEDGFFDNIYYAKCAGVTLEEMNAMERVFLSCISFRVFVDPTHYKVAEARLANIEYLLHIPRDHTLSKASPSPEVAIANPACSCE